MSSPDLRGLDEPDSDAVAYLEMPPVKRDIMIEAAKLNQMGAPTTSTQIRDRLDGRHDASRRTLFRRILALVDEGFLERSQYNERVYKHELTEKGQDVLSAGHEILGEVIDG